jgi:hypothetical protein
VSAVARLLPRYWDGRRLLQFLTGLALIALAFAVPALLGPADQPSEAPVTVITTVDTPLTPGLPVTGGPDRVTAAGNRTGLALDTQTATAGSEAAAGESADTTRTDPHGAGPVDSSAVQGPPGLPVQGRPGGRICVEARVAVGGVTQRAHRDRGPPRV